MVDWYSPARGPEAEYASMSFQANRVKPVTPLPESVMQAAITQAVKFYPTTHMKLCKLHDPNFLIHIAGHINPTASPGYPFGTQFKTNADLMDNPLAFRAVIDIAVWRAEKIASLGAEHIEIQLLADPTWAVCNNLCDPMRNFVKDEGHKYTKVANQRWRLIFSESITDQFVERLLFTMQDSAEIAVWPHIPSKSGMGLGEAQVSLLLQYAHERGISLSTDAEGWDWNAPDQLIRAEAECRIRLNTANDESWNSAVRGVTVLHSHRLLMISDGRIFKRQHIGGQASGRKITSSSNGRSRFLIDVVVGQKLGYVARAMTQGDDAASHVPPHIAVDLYTATVKELFGVNLTDAIRDETKIEFCSQTMFFDGDGIARCVPVNPQKQFINYVKNSNSPDRDQALKMIEENFRDLPERQAYFDALRAVNGA